nr:hypothetical protein BaRGS_022636 [Batillaria attramentaria]KAG5696382.1 hypothetical protein BaRGS_028377 [Batillaria attramentaria]
MNHISNSYDNGFTSVDSTNSHERPEGARGNGRGRNDSRNNTPSPCENPGLSPNSPKTSPSPDPAGSPRTSPNRHLSGESARGSGTGEGEGNAAAEAALHRLRTAGGSPLSKTEDKNGLPHIETLCRLFPHIKRSTLQMVLDSHHNDLLRAIQQLLCPKVDGHPDAASLIAAGAASRGPLTGFGPLAGGLLGTAGVGSPSNTSTTQSSVSSLQAPTGLLAPYFSSVGLTSPSLKSAFSPITSPPTAHINSVRYNAASAAVMGRSMAAFMPYLPPYMHPGLGTGYAPYGLPGATAAANKAFQYATAAMSCSCCTGKPFSHHTTPRDKSTGCIGE